jgi:nitrogen fixation protein NifB
MTPEPATVAGKDHREHLSAIADLLSDCGTIIVTEIGSLPMNVLTQRGVEVVVTNRTVDEALHSLK